MLRSSSSTFSSELVRSKRLNDFTQLKRYVLGIVLWTIGALVLFDAVVGLAFRQPSDPRQASSSLQTYFDYGRSIEGKLRRLVGSTPEQDALIVEAGWLANDCDIATPPPPGKLAFDIYGMSHSAQLAEQMLRLDSGLAGHSFGGPAAPASHSYACFVRRVEAKRERAPVQILGLLASQIPRLETISGLTTSFEGPMPFTYPRYSLVSGGRLVGFFPSITSREDLRAALADPEKWHAFLNELAANDLFYAERIFRADVFDHSVLGRMIRRAWGQRTLRDRTASLRAEDGFSGAPDISPVLRAILIDFANKARAAGERPIVILIEDRGQGGIFSKMITSTLRENRIEFITTSDIVSPNDNSNFVSDGHFTPAANEKIARAVLSLLGRANTSR